MKKLILSLTVVFAMLPISLMASDAVNVAINGEAFYAEIPAQIINNRTMLPLRAIAEALGLTVEHDEATNAAILTAEDTLITHVIGTNIFLVNGQVRYFDTNSIIVQDRTLVPVRMIAEATNANVQWSEPTRTAVILSAGTTLTGPIVIRDNWLYIDPMDLDSEYNNEPTLRFQITDATIFTFTDSSLLIIEDDPVGNPGRVANVGLYDFVRRINESFWTVPIPPVLDPANIGTGTTTGNTIPYFVTVDGSGVVSVFEDFALTQ